MRLTKMMRELGELFPGFLDDTEVNGADLVGYISNRHSEWLADTDRKGEDFSQRMQRIRNSLEDINTLMTSLHSKDKQP